MRDDPENKRRELDRISSELSCNRLSRRWLLDRLRGLGVGFGAAFLLGTKQSDAHSAPDAKARLKSTNTALSKIIEEAPQETAIGEGESGAEDRSVQTAARRQPYRRIFSRDYVRISRP
jgi:hypothetical protein